MNSPEYLKLIHQQLDGELDELQKQHLNKILREDVTARKTYEHLVSAMEAVKRLPHHDPPADLVKNVMHRIDPSRYAVRRFNLLEPILAFMEPRRGWVAAFASIIFIGVVLLSVVSYHEPENVSDLTGTIGANFPGTTMFSLSGKKFNGTFKFYSDDQKYILESGVEQGGDYMIRIQFYPGGSARLVDSKTESSTCAIEEKQNTILLQDRGKNNFVLTFSKTRVMASSVTINIDAPGESPLSKKIILN